MQFTPIHCGAITVYKVIVKTFLLRLVQRNWKRIYKMRKQIITEILNFLRKREYGFEKTPIPGLFGMLSHLKNK